MERLSTREAAKRLGIDQSTLSIYVAVGKVPAPKTVTVGRRVVHMWTEEEVEAIRTLLPKITNGRKTRYQKLRDKQGAQAGATVPHKKPKTKKQK
jgi:predicted DNA-binding transcriptional regulator AlpA